MARDLLTLGVGLGTMLYPYGLTFVGHAQSAALLFTGFLALTPGTDYTTAHDPESGRAHSRALPKARLAVAGLLVGLSVVFEYQTLLAAARGAGCTRCGACAGSCRCCCGSRWGRWGRRCC